MDYLPPIGVSTAGGMGPWDLPLVVYAILAALTGLIGVFVWTMPVVGDVHRRRLWCPGLGRSAVVSLVPPTSGGSSRVESCSLRGLPEFRVCDRRCLDEA